MNIKLKFTFFIFCLLTIIISGFSLSVYFTQKEILKEQFELNRRKIFKDFSSTCREALLVKDEILVFNTIRSVVDTHRPQIVYVGYVSPINTTYVVARDESRETEFISRMTKVNILGRQEVSIINTSNREEVHEFAESLETNGNYLGTIKVGFSQNYLNNEINKAINIIAKKILTLSMIALVLSLVLANILAIYLVNPIKKLTKASVELGSGNLDTQVDIKRKDEIGHLAKTFNEMAKKLKQLDDMKDSFVSSVSHELRSPLSAIDGYCDFLIEGVKSNMSKDKQEKALSIIKDSVNRLTTFINNILDLAKIKADRLELHKTAVNPADVINEIIVLYDQLAQKQQKFLSAEIQENLPPMNADPERIKQVITNLVGNALKFTEAGASITVVARLVNERVLNGYMLHLTKNENFRNVPQRFIEILVADTGIGIPKNELPKVFERFYQVGGNTSKKPKGTGLGLSIALEIVKLHNGFMGLESVYGKGTTFKFLIPVWK